VAFSAEAIDHHALNFYLGVVIGKAFYHSGDAAGHSRRVDD
jgi:hypothetical protein